MAGHAGNLLRYVKLLQRDRIAPEKVELSILAAKCGCSRSQPGNLVIAASSSTAEMQLNTCLSHFCTSQRNETQPIAKSISIFHCRYAGSFAGRRVANV